MIYLMLKKITHDLPKYPDPSLLNNRKAYSQNFLTRPFL